MVNIFVYSIEKGGDRCYQQIYQELIKNSKQFAKIEVKSFFNKKLHLSTPQKAKESYTQLLTPHLLKDGLNVALDVNGKELDSFKFAKMLKENSKIAFFIGGAFGFEEKFLKSCDVRLSLSKLTFSHKVAKIVLLEQIFRGFSIIHNHPYHK
ncbi:MAG: 23S rRNA (pseudouridine(1915)-N(3))-methyltransferase RlmH [Epsilonproteobacteria bacterium]|nr:23S rRNA (pseudouridine(1915)-N(3))-methyltransferase RlmH [Campylobacterota bacterium]